MPRPVYEMHLQIRSPARSLFLMWDQARWSRDLPRHESQMCADGELKGTRPAAAEPQESLASIMQCSLSLSCKLHSQVLASSSQSRRKWCQSSVKGNAGNEHHFGLLSKQRASSNIVITSMQQRAILPGRRRFARRHWRSPM